MFYDLLIHQTRRPEQTDGSLVLAVKLRPWQSWHRGLIACRQDHLSSPCDRDRWQKSEELCEKSTQDK